MINQQREHVLKSLDAGKRYDGRALDEYRKITVDTNTIRNAEGSATVKIGDTEILAGVKMGVETPYPDTPEKGNLMVNVELLPLSNSKFESGPPTVQAIEIARIIDRGIRESKTIDTEKLCIEPKEKVWSTIIDIATINANGGIIDAAALGAVAAVKNVKFPRYEDDVVNYNELTEDGLPINEKLMPITVTVYKLGKHLLVDPLPEEEAAADARLSAAIVEDGTLMALQKGEAGPISIEVVDQMIELAQRKAQELRKLI